MSGTARQTKGIDMPSLPELVPIQQTLMPPVLADVFDIPVASIPFSAQSGEQESMPVRQVSEPVVGISSAQSVEGETDACLRIPAVSPYLLPNELFGHEGGNKQVGVPDVSHLPGLSAAYSPGLLPPAGFPPVAVFPQVAQEAHQGRAGEEANITPGPSFQPAAPPQWMGPPIVGEELRHQQQQHGDSDGKTQKKTRVFWTSELKKRFEDAVEKLGIEHAKPKLILKLMNMEGLTRANVASHLQKYRMKQSRGDNEPKQKKARIESLVPEDMGGDGRSENECAAEEDYSDQDAGGSVATGDEVQTSDCSIPLQGTKEKICA